MESDIKQALTHLNKGNTILYPTDTVWGIGCDATNEEAVDKIYKIKQRINSKSMLILLYSLEQLTNYVDHVPQQVSEILNKADKPVTIIYPGAKNIASNLIAEDGTVGIRICNEPFCQKLLQEFKKPIVSTSANISGSPTPSIYTEINTEIINAVDYIVNWRQNDTNLAEPSSILKIDSNNTILLIRK